MGSRRLPGKSLADLCGQPLLVRVIQRVRVASRLGGLVIATTNQEADNPIAKLSGELQVPVFRGSENDVLDRFYRCAKEQQASVIVRLTGDNPFVDPQIVDRVIGALVKDGADYASNTIRPTFPEGLNVEVLTFAALQRAWQDAQAGYEREHVTPHIWLHPERFRLQRVEAERDLSHVRLTVDTLEDLTFARAVYERLYRPDRLFLMNDILALLEREPELQAVNANVERFSSHKKVLEQARHETHR